MTMRASSPSSLVRKSRLSTLPKDVLVELLHTVSEEYESKLKKQKECAEQQLNSVRSDYDLHVWKCAEDGCPVLGTMRDDAFTYCDGCVQVVEDLHQCSMYCSDHAHRADSWHQVKFCDGWRAITCLGSAKLCEQCYEWYTTNRSDECGPQPCGCAVEK
jgi:hypothetical protein